jgi:hypothetical protein
MKRAGIYSLLGMLLMTVVLAGCADPVATKTEELQNSLGNRITGIVGTPNTATPISSRLSPTEAISKIYTGRWNLAKTKNGWRGWMEFQGTPGSGYYMVLNNNRDTPLIVSYTVKDGSTTAEIRTGELAPGAVIESSLRPVYLDSTTLILEATAAVDGKIQDYVLMRNTSEIDSFADKFIARAAASQGSGTLLEGLYGIGALKSSNNLLP